MQDVMLNELFAAVVTACGATVMCASTVFDAVIPVVALTAGCSTTRPAKRPSKLVRCPICYDGAATRNAVICLGG
jgi:hypothetical protein